MKLNYVKPRSSLENYIIYIDIFILQPLFVPTQEGSDSEDVANIVGQQDSNAENISTSDNDNSQPSNDNNRDSGQESSTQDHTENLTFRGKDRVLGNSLNTNSTTSDSASTATDGDKDTGLGECIICQTGRSTIAFLPCRHTCVCEKCLKKLDKCPMCRGHVLTYFKIGQSDGIEDDGVNDTDSEFQTAGENWWENLNNRLNQYFGFT